MINGIQGKPGGGKSYEAVVTHIIPTVTKEKRKVVTNLPLNVDKFCDVYGEYCRELIEVIDGQFHNYGGERPFSKKDHFIQYEDWQNEQGQKVYFFIDECHLAMPSTGTEKELTEFFSMHRHYGFDIMLITQNFRKVNRDIRDMIQMSYRCIKKSHMGQDDKYILKVHDGVGTTNASVFRTDERVYESRYFPFYTSHTKNNKSVQEAATKDVQKWYNHWSIWGAIICLPIGLFIIIGALTGGESLEEKAKNANQKASKIDVKPVNNTQQSSNVLPAQVASVNSVNKPVQTKSEEPKPDDNEIQKNHPFYKVGLHIVGWGEYTELGKLTKNYYLSASQNGQHIFNLSLRDLLLAGYSVSVLSSCVIEISYKRFHDFLTCDSPTVKVFDETNELTE
ncbi:zonular occludens toxin domain-containing protein [Pseudoalteromonas sp. B131b]|uniref:zonular occludens toxin domain-containing protein n=1 Tax=Pseudoalteromonas sp. B131b TaxID=630493 RepID=UPI00301BF0DD